MSGRGLLRGALLAACALQLFRIASVAPADLELWRGRRLYAAAKYPEAAARFESAVGTSPGDTRGWAWLGDAALAVHDVSGPGGTGPEDPAASLERAARGYAGAILRSPTDSWSWTGIAEVALRRNALRARGAAIDLSEIDDRENRVLGADLAIALTAARRAVELKPSGFMERDVLADALEASGDAAGAERTYLESARTMPAPSQHNWGARRMRTPALYAKLLAALESGIARAPVYEVSRLSLDVGRFARANRDPETALRHFERSESTANNPYETFYGALERAGVLEELGRFDEAREALDRARGTGYGFGAIQLQLGHIEARTGRNAEACRALRDAIRESTADDALRVKAATACEAAGDVDAAQRLLEEGFTIPSENLVLARAYVDLLVRAGRVRVARSTLDRWVRDFPEQGELVRWRDGLASGPGEAR